MTDDAQTTMLAALNAGTAYDADGNTVDTTQWGIVCMDEDGGVAFEEQYGEASAYEAHAMFYRDIPAHVVSRHGGWEVSV
jgi:hypothetical protein